MKMQDLLNQLLVQVQDDPNLNDEMKDSTTELISLVIKELTPDNLRALAIVMEKLGDTTRYLSALETIETIRATATANQERTSS